MKKLCSIILFTGILVSTFGGTRTCDCTPSSIYHGRTGGYDYYITVYCEEGGSYILGHYTEERAEQRMAMALSALNGGNTMELQFYDSPTPVDCEACQRSDENKDLRPNGVRIVK